MHIDAKRLKQLCKVPARGRSYLRPKSIFFRMHEDDAVGIRKQAREEGAAQMLGRHGGVPGIHPSLRGRRSSHGLHGNSKRWFVMRCLCVAVTGLYLFFGYGGGGIDNKNDSHRYSN